MRTPVSNPVFSISSVFDGRVRDRTTYRIPSDRTARAVREQQRQELQARRAAAETRREMGLLRSEAERRVELAREAAQADIAQERTRYRSPR